MTAVRKLSTVALFIVVSACAKARLPDLPPSPVTTDVPNDSIESVVFWIGDAGLAEWGKSPIVHKLAADVDHHARVVARDSAVAVVYLGDNVYPGGLREAGRPEFVEDSTHLQAQVDVMRSPYARRYNAFALFVPGNHDWGHKFDEGGRRRILNQEEFLDRRRAEGINVALVPKGASPGPHVVDFGRHLRLIILDTAWWLLAGNAAEKEIAMQEVEQAMRTAGTREIAFVAHHPYRSAGPHGGLQPFWAGLGVRWLLTRSGAALQDLNSLPYRDLLDRMKSIFEAVGGPPLLFAGGHDHVLQLIEGTDEHDPRFMLVSGAGSKLSRVGHTDGLIYRGVQPGYMRMVVKTNGEIVLYIVSAPDSFLHCDHREAQRRADCVVRGFNAFRTVYGISLNRR